MLRMERKNAISFSQNESLPVELEPEFEPESEPESEPEFEPELEPELEPLFITGIVTVTLLNSVLQSSQNTTSSYEPVVVVVAGISFSILISVEACLSLEVVSVFLLSSSLQTVQYVTLS